MTTANLAFTGAPQSWVVPSGVTTALVELWGGSSSTSIHGGYRRVLLAGLTPGETVQINVGEAARADGAATFGGGGTAAGGGVGGLSGAGATDVRRGSYGLADRVAVAAGSGGSGGRGTGDGRTPGGRGGAGTGENGGGPFSYGSGGTQSYGGNGGGSGATIGTSGSGGNAGSFGGGGGGGWYGGGGGGEYTIAGSRAGAGAGGGSNGGTVTGTAVQADVQNVASPDGSVNGYARVSYGGSIAASADPGNTPPRAIISLIGFALATTATVYRVDANGGLTALPGFSPATLNSGGIVGYDYRPPFNQPVTYRAVGDDGTTVDSQPVTVTAGVPWLIHPSVPDFSTPVPGLLVPDEETSDVNGGVMYAMSRAEGVPENDGVRHSPTFELTIRTGENSDLTVDPADETAALDRIFADGSPLLLQIAYDWTTVTEYRWIDVGTLRRVRRSRNFADLTRNFVLACTEVAEPATVLQSQWTLADVAATYATLADVSNSYATLDDLFLDNRRDS